MHESTSGAMKGKQDSLSSAKAGREDVSLPLGTHTENIGVASPLRDKEDTLDVCRVCQCSESDKKGESALEYLGIYPPSNNGPESLKVKSLMADRNRKGVLSDAGSIEKEEGSIANSLQDKGPEEEICVFNTTDLEAGPCLWRHDALIKLGCSCKSDLSLAHYSCALRWFINRGSLVCEICGSSPVNVKLSDHSKIMAALKERATLRLRTAAGEVTSAHLESQPDLCADAAATARRQMITEIASWFDPHNNATASGQGTAGQGSDVSNDDMFLDVNSSTKWVVEGIGIIVAAGLLTVTFGWLITPLVGKKLGSVLPFLIGGLCAFTIVIFLRFGVLPRIRYGPARYWTILLVFWFLVFGVWASSTRNLKSD